MQRVYVHDGPRLQLAGGPPEPCLEELGAKWPLPLWTELKLVHLLE